MKTFSDIKRQIYSIQEFKYGKFLDRLLENDQRGLNELWDIYYFSLNTDFCMDTARLLVDEIEDARKYLFLPQDPNLDLSKFKNIDDLRRLFGSYCFYAYAAMESFSHEINLFYELGIKRNNVGLKRVQVELLKIREDSNISRHLSSMLNNLVIKTFMKYRNAIVHGYVYPIGIRDEGVFIKKEPKDGFFSFKGMNIDIFDFCESTYENVNFLISEGWRCFSKDELCENL